MDDLSDRLDTLLKQPGREYVNPDGIRYVDTQRIECTPTTPTVDPSAVLESVLQMESYRHHERHDLPMAVYLIHDTGFDGTFRVVCREDSLQIILLPSTTAQTIEVFLERVEGYADTKWNLTLGV